MQLAHGDRCHTAMSRAAIHCGRFRLNPSAPRVNDRSSDPRVVRQWRHPSLPAHRPTQHHLLRSNRPLLSSFCSVQWLGPPRLKISPCCLTKPPKASCACEPARAIRDGSCVRSSGGKRHSRRTARACFSLSRRLPSIGAGQRNHRRRALLRSRVLSPGLVRHPRLPRSLWHNSLRAISPNHPPRKVPHHYLGAVRPRHSFQNPPHNYLGADRRGLSRKLPHRCLGADRPRHSSPNLPCLYPGKG
jgi:hypothetical protein